MLLPRSLRRRRYGGIIKHFLLRSNELRAAAPAALGCEGQRGRPLQRAQSRQIRRCVGIICVHKSPQQREAEQRTLPLDPEQTQCCFVVAILEIGICSALLLLLLLSLQPIAFEPHRCPLSPPTPALSGCGGRPVSLRPRFPSTVAIASAAVQIRLARGQEVKLHPYYSDVRLIRLPMNKIE